MLYKLSTCVTSPSYTKPVQRKLIRRECDLFLKTSASTLLGLKQLQSFVIVKTAVENILSEGVDVAGMARMS